MGRFIWRFGDVVEEIDELVSPERRDQVALRLPLAAGMEPLNPALATATAEATPSAGPSLAPSWSSYGDDEVTAVYVSLPAGTYTLRTRMRATIPGSFTSPPATADMLYRLGTSGSSAGARGGDNEMTLGLIARTLVGWAARSPPTARAPVPKVVGCKQPTLRLSILSIVGVTLGVWGLRVARDAHLASPTPTAFITDRNGVFITQAGHENRRPDGGRQVEYGFWPMDPIVDPPERVVRATLALEDRRFWHHPGVDPLAVLRAVWQHMRGEHGSGASSLAMQGCAYAAPACPHIVGQIHRSRHGHCHHPALRSSGGARAIFAPGPLW